MLEILGFGQTVGYNMHELPVFTVAEMQEIRSNEKERIIDLIVEEMSNGGWCIQSPHTVMTYLVDKIRKNP